MAPAPSYYGPGSSIAGDAKESPPSYTHPRNNPQPQQQYQEPLQVYNNHTSSSNPAHQGVYENYSQDYNQNSKPHHQHASEGKYPRPGGPPPPPSSYGGGNGGGQQENLAFYTGTGTTSGVGTLNYQSGTSSSERRVRRKEEKRRGKDVAVGCCAGCAAACCCCGCVVM